MPDLYFSVFKEALKPGEICTTREANVTIWPLRGSLSFQGAPLASETGHLLAEPDRLAAGDTGSEFIRMTVGRSAPDPLQNSRQLAHHVLDLAVSNWLLRLDKVSFPPGATAWRHVHPGPGFRYLLAGQLRLEADDHIKVAHKGDCWFEEANSPVKAVASTEIAETAFIRLMVLPMDYKGKRTIQILSQEDRARERIQTTKTYFDAPLEF